MAKKKIRCSSCHAIDGWFALPLYHQTSHKGRPTEIIAGFDRLDYAASGDRFHEAVNYEGNGRTEDPIQSVYNKPPIPYNTSFGGAFWFLGIDTTKLSKGQTGRYLACMTACRYSLTNVEEKRSPFQLPRPLWSHLNCELIPCHCLTQRAVEDVVGIIPGLSIPDPSCLWLHGTDR